MENSNFTTGHRKGQGLRSEERREIEVRLKDGRTSYWIAKRLKGPYNTIKNEIERGTVMLYGGKAKRHKADAGKKSAGTTAVTDESGSRVWMSRSSCNMSKNALRRAGLWTPMSAEPSKQARLRDRKSSAPKDPRTTLMPG